MAPRTPTRSLAGRRPHRQREFAAVRNAFISGPQMDAHSPRQPPSRQPRGRLEWPAARWVPLLGAGHVRRRTGLRHDRTARRSRQHSRRRALDRDARMSVRRASASAAVMPFSGAGEGEASDPVSSTGRTVAPTSRWTPRPSPCRGVDASTLPLADHGRRMLGRAGGVRDARERRRHAEPRLAADTQRGRRGDEVRGRDGARLAQDGRVARVRERGGPGMFPVDAAG